MQIVFFLNYLFLCGCVLGFCCCHVFLLVAVRGAYSLVSVRGLLIAEHGLCGVQVLVVVTCGLTSCGSWALEYRLSSCHYRLSCSEACGIFLDQGLNLCPLHWQMDSYSLHHQGSP